MTREFSRRRKRGKRGKERGETGHSKMTKQRVSKHVRARTGTGRIHYGQGWGLRGVLQDGEESQELWTLGLIKPWSPGFGGVLWGPDAVDREDLGHFLFYFTVDLHTGKALN